jgi:DNA-directed RNA polymerase
MDILHRQIKMEEEAVDYSYERLKQQINKRIQSNQADELAEGRIILVHAIDTVAGKLKQYFAADVRGKASTIRDSIKCDFEGKEKDLAYIVISTIVRTVSKGGTIVLSTMLSHIRNSVRDSILVMRLHNAENTHAAFVDRRYEKRSHTFRTQKKIRLAKTQKDIMTKDMNDLSMYMAAALVDVVLKSGCNVIEVKTVWKRKKSTKHVVYTEECLRLVMQSRELMLAEYQRYPIFLVKPQPWQKFNGSGGYYCEGLYKIPMVKHRRTSRKLLREFFKVKGTKPLDEILNALQGTKWRINQQVYSVVSKVFNENMVDPESAPNNPYCIGKLPYNGSQEPEDYINVHNYGEIHTEGKLKGLPVDKSKIRKYFKDIDAQQDLINSNVGKAILLNLVLTDAERYLEEEEFYFSYQFDFRGRIYPIQQHLQPQSKSEVKALLEFADGYPIENEEQLYWFLIHGANCYGYDKEEYDVRVAKIKEKADEVVLIAEDPIRYRNYWKDADEPYLYLAWCLEYAQYLSNPDEFVSRIPIALDATCSGIQIYSGLLRDEVGAKAVNVIGDTRNDIYQVVADKVNHYLNTGDYPKIIQYRTSDGKDREIGTQALVDSIKGKITRKLTKRNTMTQPYSVTKYGMFEQLKEELKEIEGNNDKFWVGENWLFAKLLADLNDKAIIETVRGARIGQKYLKEVTAGVVAKNSYIFFTTPLTQFPVLQKIHREKVDVVKTPIGELNFRTTLDSIHKTKMVNGIAPNFVHSLDAALLAVTVLKLHEEGCKDFHMIHDSYGVPVTYVPLLNKRVRETFVELFETDPLNHFITQVYPDMEPRPGEVMINSLNLSQVLDSKYIFS